MNADPSNTRDDLGSPDTRPCFYKIHWMANMPDLIIPPDFKHHLMNELADEATLKGPCGSQSVKMVQENEDLLFGEGWQEFSRQHSLGNQEMLIFKYNGNMSFDMDIYDRNGCIRKYDVLKRSDQEPLVSFNSSFPFFRRSIKKFNVGKHSSLAIPAAFSRAYLASPVDMILRNSEGVCWIVSLYLTRTDQFFFVRGWKAFADDNSLEIGNECIFEMVDENTMQVHIVK